MTKKRIIRLICILSVASAMHSRTVFAAVDSETIEDEEEVICSSWSDEKAEEIDTLVESVREAVEVPSFSVGIVCRERLVYAKATGYRRLSDASPATTETRYQIGSISKAITATLLAILVDRGDLALDDPISKFLPPSVELPRYRGSKTEITVWHLATHSAGLPRDPPNRKNIWHGVFLNPGQARPYSIEELYKGLQKTRLRFEPGTAYNYSNFGYGLLGHILERAARQPLTELLKVSLFHPLGMDDTTIELEPDKLTDFATHYWADDRKRPRIDRPATQFGEIFAHGGMVSSVHDLAHFISYQLGAHQRSKPPAMISAIRTPQRSANGEPFILQRDDISMEMAIGWRVQSPEKNGGIVNHSGEMDGHSAFLAFAPEAEIGIIVLANLGGARNRKANPTAAVQLGIKLKEAILYPALGWDTSDALAKE
ncbi:MAG: serine hydrolase domain-containing protein [Verrucomicrobiota bacterium]